MLARGLGGIEQVFLDYTEMMRAEGLEVIPVIHPQAAIRPQVPDAVFLPNRGTWDVFAMLRMQKLIATHKPDIILTHGRRALAFGKQGKRVVPVGHNYWLQHFRGLKNALAITEDVAQELRKLHVKNVQVVPNIVHVPMHLPARPIYRTPPVIGAMGRFVHKKGFDIFIQALATLKARNIPFNAVLGGSGEEERRLKSLAHKLGLENQLRFIGWVEDKDAFFEQIDIFCLPSRSEPFGIVLLEAFAHGVPVVSSMNEGASVIANNEHDAILYGEGRLADELGYLLKNELVGRNMVSNAFEKAKSYQPAVIGKKLKEALEKVE